MYSVSVKHTSRFDPCLIHVTLKKHTKHTGVRTHPLLQLDDHYKTADFKKIKGGKELTRQESGIPEGPAIPDSLESGLRSTRGVHLAGSDDVACKIVQNHLPGGLKM